MKKESILEHRKTRAIVWLATCYLAASLSKEENAENIFIVLLIIWAIYYLYLGYLLLKIREKQ